MHGMPRAMRIYWDEVFKHHKARRQSRSSQNSRPSNADSLRHRPKLPLAIASDLCQAAASSIGTEHWLCGVHLLGSCHEARAAAASCGNDASEHTAPACRRHSGRVLFASPRGAGANDFDWEVSGSGGRLIAEGLGLSLRSDFVIRQARSKSTASSRFSF
jgi:hypothetical protein